MAAAVWFPGEGRDADDEVFLAELRACCDGRGLVDATPQDTTLFTWEHVLVLLVDVPALQEIPAAPTLEVVIDLRRELFQAGLGTHQRLADDVDNLELPADERRPSAFARQAFAWFVAQLSRPPERVARVR